MCQHKYISAALLMNNGTSHEKSELEWKKNINQKSEDEIISKDVEHTTTEPITRARPWAR